MIPRTVIVAMALWLAAPSAWAEKVAVLGDGAAFARAIAAPDREVLGPDTARSLLEARRTASADPDAARALASAGREAYAGAFFDEAVDELTRAAATYLATGLDEVTPGELAALHLDLGLARLAAGQREPAEREVALALRLDPAIAPGPQHGPPVRRFVDEVRRSSSRSAVLARTIASDPPGATIHVDGRERGATPVSVADLAAGSHLVVLAASGRPPLAVRVEVSERTEEPISLALPAADPARAALDALRAGDGETAATLARLALDVDVAVVVARGARVRAFVARRQGVNAVDGATDEEIASRTFAVRRGAPPEDPGRRAVAGAAEANVDEGGGVTWWLVGGGAALVAAGAVTAAILLSADEGDRTLVPRLRDP